MSRRRTPDFKPTQVFDWASEPVDERPTDFGRSTGYGHSTLSGFGSLPEVHGSAHRRHARAARSGMLKLAMSVGLVLSVGVAGLLTMASYLRG